MYIFLTILTFIFLLLAYSVGSLKLPWDFDPGVPEFDEVGNWVTLIVLSLVWPVVFVSLMVGELDKHKKKLKTFINNLF